MLEEPLRSPSYLGTLPSRLFDDPFFAHSTNALRPAVDVTEEGNSYIVEAELPGVKKENLQVRIGDGGRSVTIEGKTHRRGESPSTKAQESTSDDGGLKNSVLLTVGTNRINSSHHF